MKRSPAASAIARAAVDRLVHPAHRLGDLHLGAVEPQQRSRARGSSPPASSARGRSRAPRRRTPARCRCCRRSPRRSSSGPARSRPRRLGRVDHRHADPVLDAARRVDDLQLARPAPPRSRAPSAPAAPAACRRSDRPGWRECSPAGTARASLPRRARRLDVVHRRVGLGLALGEVGDRGRAEGGLERVDGLGPDLVGGAGAGAELAVEQLGDLEHGDLGGRAGEQVAALDAALALEDAGAAERREQALEELDGDLARLAISPIGTGSAAAAPRELGERADRVRRLGRDRQHRGES